MGRGFRNWSLYPYRECRTDLPLFGLKMPANDLSTISRNPNMFGKILDVIDKILTFFEDWTLFLSVLGCLVALFFNVVLRYGFNYTLAWSEELVREVIIYTTLIGCGAAVKNRSMIKIDAVVQLVPKLKGFFTLLSNVVTMIFGLMMLYYGWKMAALQVATQQKTIIMQIPLVYLYALLPIMGTTMILRTIQIMYQDFQASAAVRQKA
jgi:TRAP-type C4-dicarboxylate transport system permease small subunit